MSNKYVPNTNIATQNQLVQWINDAGMADGGKKVNLLRKIIEVLLHQGAQFLSLYIQNILSFGSDKSNDVKKQVIVFIEEISKQHPEYLPDVISQLQLLVLDSVIAVQKRAIQAASIVYRNSLQWLCMENAEPGQMKVVWEHLSEIKLIILNMIDNDNEGIRTHSIKFLEEVILLQSPGEASEGDFSLDSLPSHLAFIKIDLLEEESEHIFNLIVNFHNSQHISSVNLMACMTTICLIAKFRPKYMTRVIQALGDLHTTLPPTLTQSQVNSVRKHLKMLVINLVKHPSSNNHMPQLTQLLIDIGMSTAEINKALPKEKRNKRLGEVKHSEIPSKRFRIDSPQSNSQSSDSNSRSEPITEIRPEAIRDTRNEPMFDEDSNQSIKQLPSKPEEKPVSEDTFYEGLDNVELVVNLVVSTLVNGLPNEMPANFATLYKPIPNSGSAVQKRSLAKMIMGLIQNELDNVTPAPMPVQPPVVPPLPVQEQQQTLSEIAAKIPLIKTEDEEKATLKNAVAKLQETSKADRQNESAVSSAVSKLMEETRADHLKEEERKAKERVKPIPPQTPTVPKLKQRVKLLKLQEITRPIPKEIKEKMVLQAVDRILRAEKESLIGGAAQIRSKFITIFASSYTPEIRDLVLNYILDDPANRIDLALNWLYEEYAFMQGFNRHPVTLQPKMHEKHDQNYSQLLCALITQICERGDPVVEAAKDVLLRKIYSECPLVTDEAVDYLKHLVTEEKMAVVALEILEEICVMRPPRSHKYVTALVFHVLNHQEDIRASAIKSVVKIYKRSSEATRKVIEKQARLYLGFIALAQPPSEVLALSTGYQSGYKMPWTDNLYKLCLNLIMTLLLENEDLIIEVSRVYGCCDPEAKRVVLRCVESPVRAAMARGVPAAGLRPALSALLDECPRGAETLLTRFVHIYTEKAPPTPELVSKIRDLYATRVSDVRFLIPVLTGLTKKEIIAALPKFIKLNPAIVKEVFNKLLGVQNPDEPSPVSPAELLTSLHLIDPSKADLKFIIKATAICFGEKHIFTQDVVSAVLQRLTEENELPVLMMRSVLQALTLYPALGSLALNILQLLLEKEVWHNKVAWEGWIKCCERLLPASTFLLLSLPAEPLKACVQLPRVLAALQHHVAQLAPHDVAALPPHVAALQHRAPEPQYMTPNPQSTTPPMPMPSAMPVSMPMSMPMPSAMPVPMPVPMPGMNLHEPLPPGME